jgi:hypothetical protein
MPTCEVCFSAAPSPDSHCARCDRARCCDECLRGWSLASGRRRCVICREELKVHLNLCELTRVALALSVIVCYYTSYAVFLSQLSISSELF